MSTEHVEALIVGNGAAGSVFAARLAQAGRQVLVLDAGPARKLAELYSSQVWARRLKAATPHIPDTHDPIWSNLNRAWGAGGAALHHYACWPRMHVEDFRAHALFGKAYDWPIEYSTLRPYYDRVQAEVGIAGDAVAEHWRPPGDPYPLPPVLVTEQGRRIAVGFEKLGLTTAPFPMAVLTAPYKGRAACIWDGWCDAGCPTGALANPLVTYWPMALAAGATVRHGCRVSRVLVEGGRAVGVEYRSGGELRRIRAELVVLAAFTLENARILLASAVANSSGLVGKYLMTHPSTFVYGLFEGDLQNHVGTTGGQLLSQDAFDKATGHPGFGSRHWCIAMTLRPNDHIGIGISRPDIYGAALDPFLRKAARGLGNILAVCEDQPIESNRVELDTERDADELPRLRSVYKVSADAEQLRENARGEGIAILKAAGATEAWIGGPFSQHILGGTRMGADPKSSVTDGYGRTHDLENLYLAGPGLFPTGSCVNPTFTVHALAERSAEHLIRHWPV